MPARRSSAATIVLDAAPSSILAFEDFVEVLAFLSPSEKCRILVAGGEMFDNVVKHGAPLRDGRVAVRARRGRSGPAGRAAPIQLAFFFKAQSFAAFALECASGGEGIKKPLFDPAHRRWRGFGLVMCRNLARRVVFRPGELMDRIFLEFEPEA
jgi:two-component sensor histidine kinase